MTRWLMMLMALWALAGCRARPPTTAPAESVVARRESPLDAVASKVAGRVSAEQSGMVALADGGDALRWRLALIDAAQRSIDIQVYLWHDDVSGLLVLDHVMAAAERGVRVRLLVDDFKVKAPRNEIATLDAHPNIEAYLFNVFESKPGNMAGRSLEIALRSRLNHRMHNKMLVADDRVAIAGGRNIGDEYFGLGDEVLFIDLDVLGVGPIARELRQAFEVYLGSASSTRGRDLGRAGDYAVIRQRVRDGLAAELAEREARQPGFESRFVWSATERQHRLADFTERAHAASARVLYDRPELRDGDTTQAARQLRGFSVDAREELLVAMAYFVPDEAMMTSVQRLREQGAQIRIVTNSLATNDVLPVHTAYKEFRRPLLVRQALLHELRVDPAAFAQMRDPTARARHAALHTKAAVVDSERVFIGSLNFDPRGMELNTELAVVVDSPGLGRDVREILADTAGADNAWQVQLDSRGRLRWVSDAQTQTAQPARNAGQRIGDWFFGFLPIEDQV